MQFIFSIRHSNQEACCFSVIMVCMIMQCWDLILQINLQIIFMSGKMVQELITFQKVGLSIQYET